jgi:predicted aspartyl protease
MTVSRRELLAGAGLGAALARFPAAASEPVIVPLVYDAQGGLFVEARIDGREPVRLILDTGASRSAISAAYAEELGLETVDGGEVEGTAGVVAARQAAVEVALAGLEPLRLDALVYGFASYDERCVGILGRELLERAPFQLRYSTRELVWNAEMPGTAPGTAPETLIDLRLDQGIPRVRAELQSRSIELRIDTGASLAPSERAYVNLAPAQARELALDGPPVAVFSATGTGGAVLELPVHRLASASVAGVRLEQPFAIVQPAVGYFARPEAVGFLGNSVLDKLDPYFDYARGKLGAGRGA